MSWLYPSSANQRSIACIPKTMWITGFKSYRFPLTKKLLLSTLMLNTDFSFNNSEAFGLFKMDMHWWSRVGLN